MTEPPVSRTEWAHVHDKAAPEYKAGEWSRELLFGVGALRKRLFRQAKGNVLDVACGYGINFSYLTNAAHISGVELSPVMLGMARQRVQALGIRADLYEGDAEALDFPDDTFDTVISALSTCSFLNPIAALQEMRRVCKPGGRILLLEHGRSSWEWAGRYQDRHAAEQLERAGCHWNRQPQELVRAAGLEIVSARRTFFGVFHAIEALPAKA